MNFMNLKGLFLQSVTLLAAPRGARRKVGHRRQAKWRRVWKREGEEVQKVFTELYVCSLGPERIEALLLKDDAIAFKANLMWLRG